MAKKQLGVAPTRDVDAVTKEYVDSYVNLASNSYSATIGDGSATSIAVTHNLGTSDVVVSVSRLDNGKIIACDVTKTSGNIVTLTFATAPALNSLRCTVVGTAFGVGSPTPTSSVSITDATATGRSLMTAADATAARSAVDAGRVSVVNVKDYVGIDLTGTTASDTAFQAILDAAAADAAAGAGIVEVYIPPGTISLTTAGFPNRAKVGAGVTIRGAGRGATTVKSSNEWGVFQLVGESDITIADLTVQSVATTGATAIPIVGDYSAGLQKRVTVTGCRITGSNNNAVRFAYAIEQLTFTDNIIEDCKAGFTLTAPTLASGLISNQIVISRNRCRNVGTVNIQVYGAGPGSVNAGTVSTVFNVEITGNDLRDFDQTASVDGPIPIEPTGITNVRIANNVIEGPSTRGITTGNNVNMTITGNTIRNQSIYAFELNGGRQISIVGNTAEDCASFAHETGYGLGGVRLSDVVIADNVYVGSGRSTAPSWSAIKLFSARRVRISGNVFTDWQYLTSAIRIGFAQSPPPEDCVVEGNTFVISDANTPLTTVAISTAIRTNVSRNTLRVNRNLVAGDNHIAAISASMNGVVADTLIDGNHIMFTGTVDAAPYASGVGNDYATAAASVRLTVRRNHIVNGPRGLRLITNSTDLVVHDNVTSTCAAADVIPGTATVITSASLAGTETLTGKTLTTPKISQIKDANGNTWLNNLSYASAVNYITLTNGEAGAPVSIIAEGTDTDIPLIVRSKGTGSYIALSPNAVNALQIRPSTTPVNYWRIYSADSGGSPELNVTTGGSDANVSMNLTTRGTGTIKANGVDVVTTTGAQTLSGKTLTTPTLDGTATINQTSTAANATFNFTEASVTKAYLQYRGTTAGTSPNTVRFQTVIGTDADIQIGTNSNTDIFIAGGQNGLNRGYVGLGGNLTPAVTLDVTGEARVSVAGANAASVVTVGGTQTLVNKQMTTIELGHASDTTLARSAAGVVTIEGRTAMTVSLETITGSKTFGSVSGHRYVVLVGASGAPILPTAVSNTSLYTFKNIDTVDRTISTTSSQTIDGSATTWTLSPGAAIEVVSDGTGWRVL